MGQSWGWGYTWVLAVPLCCSCPGMFASSGSCTGQPHHRRGPRGLQAMATQEAKSPHTHPGAGLTASPGHILHPVTAQCKSPSASPATGPRLCWGTTGEHQVAAQGGARACSGSPGRSPGEVRSRGVQSPAPHPDHGADCPSHIFTPCPSKGPIQR